VAELRGEIEKLQEATGIPSPSPCEDESTIVPLSQGETECDVSVVINAGISTSSGCKLDAPPFGGDGDLPNEADALEEIIEEAYEGPLVKHVLTDGSSKEEANEPYYESLKEGDVAIKVKMTSAKALRRADWAPGGLSTPFCTCEIVGKRDTTITSRTVDRTLDPAWHHEEVMPDYEPGDIFRFTVYDEDWSGSSDLLGTVDLDSAQFSLTDKICFRGDLPLTEAGKDDAQIKVEIARAYKGADILLLKNWQDESFNIGANKSSRKSVVTSVFGKDSDLMSCAGSDTPELTRGRGLYSLIPRDFRAVSPEAPVRLAWDIIGIFILFIDLTWIPMQVFEPIRTVGIVAMGWTTLLYWTGDIVVAFNTGIYSASGEQLILNRCTIAKKYIVRWFAFDFILVAFDWGEIFRKVIQGGDSGASDSAGAARAGRVVRITRIVRLLRLMRLAKLRHLLFVLQSLIESEWLIVVFAVLKNMSMIIMLNHFLACAWFFVGQSSDKNGWVQRMDFDTQDYGIQYLAALHWSLAQFTPGATPLFAESVSERVFAVCMMAIALVLATCFVSSITTTMAAVWEVNRYKNTQTFLLKKFLHQTSISREVCSRVTRYVDCVVELRHKTVPIHKVEYLKMLSGPLNVELHTALFKPHMLTHGFFSRYHDVSKTAMRRLCSMSVHTEHYAKNDTIFERGAEAKFMMFTTKGSLAYRFFRGAGQAAKTTMRIDLHQWSCEPALWLAWIHRGHMKGLTDCELMLLNVDKFADLTSKGNRNVFQVARDEAIEFALRMRCLESFGRAYVADIPSDRLALLASEAKGSKTHRWKSSELHKAEEMELQLLDFSDSEDEATKDSGGGE